MNKRKTQKSTLKNLNKGELRPFKFRLQPKASDRRKVPEAYFYDNK